MSQEAFLASLEQTARERFVARLEKDLPPRSASATAVAVARPARRPGDLSRVNGAWMLECSRTFTYTDEDGRREEFTAGKTRVAPGHRVLATHRAYFKDTAVPYGNQRVMARI